MIFLQKYSIKQSGNRKQNKNWNIKNSLSSCPSVGANGKCVLLLVQFKEQSITRIPRIICVA